MQETLPLTRGGVISSGLMSNLTREANEMVISPEDSSSYSDELELGLGLSLGGGRVWDKHTPPPPAAASGVYACEQWPRILTAKDLPWAVSGKDATSSSSSSSSVTKANINNGSSGTKRSADPPSSPPSPSAISSQVVGWPPVRAYRMNSLANQSKSPVTEDFFSAADKCKSKNSISDKAAHDVAATNNSNAKEKWPRKVSLFVKVNMDGIAIGRKLDLSSYGCYQSLARALDDMFRQRAAAGAKQSDVDGSGMRHPLRLLDSSSDFVLTYEDKDGDWMLVGDVPWEMFLNTARRLRIMRAADTNGLAPGSIRRT